MSLLSTLKLYTRRKPLMDQPSDLYSHCVTLLDGSELDLTRWRGHPMLVVNTASKCGFTPQYAGLQSLYERYHEAGLEILGSPSGDFAGQEYDDAGAIEAFCHENYDVQFPLTERTSVRAHPERFWSELTSQPGSAPPKWNFTKYLIGADGHLIDHWGPTVAPLDERITAAIEVALAAAPHSGPA
jgi:glutathione peroxidase